MNFVQPIRDPNIVRNLVNYFKEQSERNYIMFLMGIYAGRRIGDILALRVKDVKGKNCMIIKEKKTKKTAVIDFNPELKRALANYCQDKKPDDYLIRSNKGVNTPITRQAAYGILKKASKKFGLQNIGTHTMRKTFGYHLYMNCGKNIVLVMNALGHSSESITLRYIGITGEQVNTAIKSFKY